MSTSCSSFNRSSGRMGGSAVGADKTSFLGFLRRFCLRPSRNFFKSVQWCLLIIIRPSSRQSVMTILRQIQNTDSIDLPYRLLHLRLLRTDVPCLNFLRSSFCLWIIHIDPAFVTSHQMIEDVFNFLKKSLNFISKGQDAFFS